MKFIVCPDLNNKEMTSDGDKRVIAEIGGEKVTAKNDGGFAIEYHNGKKWLYNSKWPYATSTDV
jgi:hypothetical protein